jgi:hypothetical protein
MRNVLYFPNSPIPGKEIELDVNADKPKYTVKSRDQNAGRSHNIKTDNSSFERVEELKCLGTKICRSWRVNNRSAAIPILAGNTWKIKHHTKQATNESKHQTH